MNFSSDQSSSSSSSISIYHNSYFSFEDVEYVLRPLFQSYYGREGLRSIIYSVNHTWCVYDRQISRYVGCALIETHDTDNVLYVKLLGVKKSSQGQGIGTQLLKTIKRWAQKQNYFALVLHTQINNDKAIRLYEKVGFVKQYYLKDFFQSSGLLSLFQFSEPGAYQMILYL
ncbi:unnamed protein product [Rotaria magnacalcarata]|uniref:N-acetyltransferase domain-containing protein n=1 Tax=Rotaria magnacalcarata TaxID=392030 RepID=A0A819Z8Y2_9BILA|nr:unnamed protein product [Rotaria magnacalcarata]CAF2107881.1 unnamed protein product [Rotaria magnacalcarata]CAF4170322.1 unnamed protein product [Rotaria magnacalcarata]CAF4330490.1 unnamed protein product [Rotaria magnacalcarata]